MAKTIEELNSETVQEISSILPNISEVGMLPSLVDFHVHINDNSDGVYSIAETLDIARKNNVSHLALVQHNNLNAWMDFLIDHGLPRHRPIHNVNGVNVIPAVEITCRDSFNTNLKGNSVKLHLIVLAPKLTKDSPLVKLLQIKSMNDKLVDYGLLNYIAEIRGITIDAGSIRNYVIEKRNEVSGFNTFGAKDTIAFFERYGITVAKSERELEYLISKGPRVQRLNLEMKDVIKIAHASGALVIFAHPPANLRRTSTPEITIKNFLTSGGDGFELITSSMDEDCFKLIMDTTSKVKTHNKVLFTGGSDTHIVIEDVTIGKTAKGYITEESQLEVLLALRELDVARVKGKLTARRYTNIDEKEIDKIIRSYAKLEKAYERVYLESKNKNIALFSDSLREEESEILEQIDPKSFSSYLEYILACNDEVIKNATKKVDEMPTLLKEEKTQPIVSFNSENAEQISEEKTIVEKQKTPEEIEEEETAKRIFAEVDIDEDYANEDESETDVPSDD